MFNRGDKVVYHGEPGDIFAYIAIEGKPLTVVVSEDGCYACVDESWVGDLFDSYSDLAQMDDEKFRKVWICFPEELSYV